MVSETGQFSDSLYWFVVDDFGFGGLTRVRVFTQTIGCISGAQVVVVRAASPDAVTADVVIPSAVTADVVIPSAASATTLVAALAALSFFTFATAASAQDTEPALKLTQRHNYWGDTETIVSMNGVRINNKGRMKYSLVARSPQWKVIVFRDDDKTFISQSLRHFEKTGLISDFVVKQYPHHIGEGTPVRKGKIGDLTTQIWTDPFAQLETVPLKNITTQPVEAILYAAYKLPTNSSIPIRYTKIMRGSNPMFGPNERGSRKEYFKTLKVEHIKVPLSLFEAPHGYTRCKSVQEVLLSKVNREASGDFDELFKIKDRTK